MLSKLLSIYLPSELTTLIDLGCGSSVPTIRAILENPQHRTLDIVGVDIDQKAIYASSQNILHHRFKSRYSFFQKDMMDFLSRWEFGNGQVIVSNPPYLPVREDIVKKYLPVDGGSNGIKYIEKLLTYPFPAGTIVALLWSSLSHPTKVIKILENAYEVVHLQAYEVPFGSYSGSEALQPHFESQKMLGESLFFPDNHGDNHFMILGSILKKC